MSSHSAAVKLARSLLSWERKYPAIAAGQDCVLSARDWQRLVKLAHQVVVDVERRK